MNTIRNYLDNMFRNLPNTEEVRKAKFELLQMMEDKYEELIKEGKTENEAIGIVISEFGNLDELADSLGITEAVQENPVESKPMLSMDRVQEYLAMRSTNSILKPLAIALCIFAPACNILCDMFPNIFDVIGVSGMFVMIAAAVGLFIYTGQNNKKFIEVKKKECSLSIESAEYVRNERKGFKNTYSLMSSFGIGLCILSVLNPMIFDRIPYVSSNIGAALLMLFVAAGVFLITSANVRMNGYDNLLELNESGKMSEEFVPKADRKVNKAPIIICSVIAVLIAVIAFSARIAVPLVSGIVIKDKGGFNISTLFDDEATETIYEKSDVTGDVSSIKLDLTACSVDFKVQDGTGVIAVDYSGDKRLQPDVDLINGRLVVTQKGSVPFTVGMKSGTAPKLTIVIGRDSVIDNLEIKSATGDIHLNGIKTDYFFGDFDAGNIEIDDCCIRKCDIDADAGNINIEDSEVSILRVNTDAGNVEIKRTSPLADVEIGIDFGNVSINDIGDLGAYDADIHIDAGSAVVGNDFTGRNYTSKGTGAGTIKIRVDAGTIAVH